MQHVSKAGCAGEHMRVGVARAKSVLWEPMVNWHIAPASHWCGNKIIKFSATVC